MLFVSGVPFAISTMISQYPENGIERQLLSKMSASEWKYEYNQLDQLKFELDLRKEIVNSAKALNRSGLDFADFKHSRCNPKYWTRTDNGGFLLSDGVNPSEAISDIFTNGREYATECATAIVIIYYKALLNVFGDNLFDTRFPKIYLMDWDVREPLLEGVNIPKPVADFLLGDRAYFNNPDFNPKTPEWQGENVIVLPDALYYGHGIGIATADAIMKALNARRRGNATQSAYLLHSAARPNFKRLSDAYYGIPSRPSPLVWGPFPAPI